MEATIINIDTVQNVKALIKKVQKLIKTTTGAIKEGWIDFLEECREFVKEHTPKFKTIEIKITTSAWVRIFQIGDDRKYGNYRVQLVYNGGENASTMKTYSSLKRAKIAANKIKANY